VDLYEKVVHPTLIARRGAKRSFVLVEDNDPTGYKSRAALACKRRLHVRTLNLPPYSPDLNPLDFFLWEEVATRMKRNAPAGIESIERFKLRLRRTAMRIPTDVILRGVAHMRERVRAVVHAKGGDIQCD
jgi:hypothetical protein